MEHTNAGVNICKITIFIKQLSILWVESITHDIYFL